MPKPGKQPQDRKKPAEKLRDEAQGSTMDNLLGRKITVAGRLGSVEVTVLEDPMEWDDDVDAILGGWQKAGGIIVGEVIPLLKRIVSLEDGHRIEQVRPTRKAALDLIDLLTAEAEDGEESPGEVLGESQAS